MKPENLDIQGFVERLKAVIGNDSIRSFSAKAGMSHGALAGYVRGENEPTRVMLAKIATAANVNLTWLITGEGPMRPGEAAPVAEPAVPPSSADRMPTDRELMGRCIDAINKLYQDLNMKIPMVDMGREAADLHDEVSASGATGLEEQLGAIRFAIAQRRRAILTAPPSSKQQGSA